MNSDERMIAFMCLLAGIAAFLLGGITATLIY